MLDERFADNVDYEFFRSPDVRSGVLEFAARVRDGNGHGWWIVGHLDSNNMLPRSIYVRILMRTMLNQLKGARLSTPDSETEETNATGRGTIPLIIRRYYPTCLYITR